MGRSKKNKAANAVNEKERRFVVAFMGECVGNGAAAARAAGYATKSARITAAKLLTKPNIKAAIMAAVMADPNILKRDELQRFWSAIALGKLEVDPIRIRASELLGKSQAVFTDVVKSGVTDDLLELLGSLPVPPPPTANK